MEANEQTQLPALELTFGWKNNQIPWSVQNRELAPYVSVEVKSVALVYAEEVLERSKTLLHVEIVSVR